MTTSHPAKSEKRLAAAVLATGRLPSLLSSTARAVVNGVWLGLLSEAAVTAVDELYYAGEEAYRTDPWNERGLFDWEREAVARHFPAGGRVTVAACGGGREVLALLREGYAADGYESHDDLLGFAARFLTRHGHGGRAHPCPRDAFPPDATADAAILGWGAYSLVHGRQRRQRMLAQARACLPSDGPLLLSFFERSQLGRELTWTAAIANALRRVRDRPPVEPGDTLAPNRVHVFTPHQLAEEANASGFAVAEHRTIAPADGAILYAYAVLRAR